MTLYVRCEKTGNFNTLDSRCHQYVMDEVFEGHQIIKRCNTCKHLDIHQEINRED